uniref:Uncharacterized protein n=1 Tax=Acartia pacifica TaxID=335913 RepID=R9TFY5_ACAPC|nr:hypothetical protein [Acartia pacifica]
MQGSSGNWKRPINRMYSYNYQVGENYYLPMKNYIDSKETKPDIPGPLCFSERIAANALNDIKTTMSYSRKETKLTSIVSSTVSL